MRKVLSLAASVLFAMTVAGYAQMESSYNAYENVTRNIDENGNLLSVTVTYTLEGDTVWYWYPPCQHTGEIELDFGGQYGYDTEGPAWPNYYMNVSLSSTLLGSASCFANGCYATHSATVTCDCSGEFYREVGSDPIYGFPTSEITTFSGFMSQSLYLTRAQFEMTLLPGTYSYDGHYVTEGGPGTNGCWWPGSELQPTYNVQGSTWTVANGHPHNKYGFDSIGFNIVQVNYIQQYAAGHIALPCYLTYYQQMSYELDANTFFAYANNTLQQTIGSNTVKVCRAGVCSDTITSPY